MEHLLPPEASSELEIANWITRHLAEKLGMEPAQISPQVPLQSYGLPISEAMVLWGDLQSWLGRQLPPTLLLEYDTIEKLARHLALTTAETPEPVAAQAAPAEAVLSLAQERLWVLEQLAPGTSLYTIPDLAIRFTGPLDLTALAASLSEIARRHETLRMTFQEVAGRPVPVVSAPQPIEVTPIDLQDLPVDAREDAARARLAAALAQPFDLVRGPLWRPILLRLAPEEHILALPLHHLIADGWSAGVLIRELELLYSIYHQGGQPDLPELPIRYTAFAARQRQQLQGQTAEKLLDFWRDELADATEPLALPCDYPRPAASSYRGRRHFFGIPGELAADLKRLAQEYNVTLFTTLFAAFQTLLFRYTGQEQFIVGVPTHGRRSAELRPLIGLFVNTVPLRCDLSEAPTFAALLERVNGTRRRSFEHQDMPFQQLVAELQTERDLSRAPLFQVMFVLQNWPLHVPVFPDLQVAHVVPESNVAQYDLSLSIFELQGQITATMEYSTDLFQAATIERMAGHFLTLLAGIVADPQQKITHLPLLTPAERHQVLVEWNDSAKDYPRDRCLHEFFQDQVERTPETLAVRCGDEHLTYRELNQRANQLAHYLRKLGVGPGILVGTCTERSIEMVVALLGILKAGGAYVPLDPRYPPERLAFMLENADISVLLTQQRLVAQLPEHPGYVIRMDEDWATIAAESLKNLANSVTPDNLVYVIYTSGSTGMPKGAEVYQSSFVNLLNWYITEFELTASDRTLILTSFSFDMTQKNIYAPLLVGGQLHIVPSEDYNPIEIVREVCEEGITWINCTSSAFYPLVDQGKDSVRMKETLRFIFLGGESLSIDRIRAWIAAEPRRTEIVNAYGPTECADICTVYRVREPSRFLGTQVPIGKPIHNVKVYVLDANLEPLPIGVVGELCVGGEGVGQGYLSNPDLTLTRFVPDPFSAKPNARLYRTGDLARYLPDGNLEFMGRTDQQVKLRGFRIELGEIEATLALHSGVRQAVVVTQDNALGDKTLVGYVVPQEGATLSAQTLHQHCLQSLPQYMAPSAFMFLDALPLTPNGKIDRRRLPAPDFANPQASTEFVAPRDELERTLTDIWADVLQHRPIGIHDNFFEIGGHSLSAVRVVSRIHSTLQVEVPLRLMFESPTIASLAAAIRQKQGVAPVEETAVRQPEASVVRGAPLNPALVPIKPHGSRPPLFCIHPASGVVFPYYSLANYLEPDRPLYAIQDPAVEANRTPRDHVEEMAADYIGAIQQVQPHGPYHLAGWSFGGHLAYEVARQLTQQGEPVGLVGLIDTPAPEPRSHRSKPLLLADRQFLHQMRMILVMVFSSIPHIINGLYLLVAGAFRRRPPGATSPSLWVRLRWLWLQAWRTQLLKQAGMAKYVDAHDDVLMIDLPALQRLLWLVGHHNKVDARYVPIPFAGRVTLFRAALSLGHDLARDPTMGWSRLALSGVDVHSVPGNHVAVLSEPNIRDFTRTLVQTLHEIEGEGDVSTITQ